MNEILGKIAIITGASGGIGAATALNFAREGAGGIVIADLDSENAKVTINNIMKETNCRCEFIKTNIGKKDDIENLFKFFDVIELFTESTSEIMRKLL